MTIDEIKKQLRDYLEMFKMYYELNNEKIAKILSEPSSDFDEIEKQLQDYLVMFKKYHILNSGEMGELLNESISDFDEKYAPKTLQNLAELRELNFVVGARQGRDNMPHKGFYFGSCFDIIVTIDKSLEHRNLYRVIVETYTIKGRSRLFDVRNLSNLRLGQLKEIIETLNNDIEYNNMNEISARLKKIIVE